MATDPFHEAFKVAKKSHDARRVGAYDDHSEGHEHTTLLQLTLAVLWITCCILYTVRILFRLRNGQPLDRHLESKGGESLSTLENGTTPVKLDVDDHIAEVDNTRARSGFKQLDNGVERRVEEASRNKSAGPGPTKPPAIVSPSFDDFLQGVAVFGIILFYFYLIEYKKVLPHADRHYSIDGFLFIVFLLFLVASAFTVTNTQDKILNRDQTEEWKGWMQVMFVWYHYFKAAEWYNWVRIYIATYVWMTGFGNFSFFWIKKDYSLYRLLKMLFRLNFLVLFVCATVSNEYMLYYICAMHTYWFLSVYATMAVFPSWNTCRYKMAAKFLAYAVANAIIFEIPGLCAEIFRPLRFFMAFHNGKYDPMHEWEFRAGLDHWAAFIGMLCAYNYPHFEGMLLQIESMKNRGMQLCIKLGTALILGLGLMLWYAQFMHMSKYDYNSAHPYTSWIPILIFIVFRNSFPVLRMRYLNLFAWLGKITLETYLSQLHVYLQSNAKHTTTYIAGYPLLNFSLATIIYLAVSYVLFKLTNRFSAFLIPHDLRQVAKNALIVLISLCVSAAIAGVLFELGLVR